MPNIAPRLEDFQTPLRNETREEFLLRFLFADAAHDVGNSNIGHDLGSSDDDPIKPEEREAFIAALHQSKETSLVVTPELFDDLPQDLKDAIEKKMIKVAQARRLDV